MYVHGANDVRRTEGLTAGTAYRVSRELRSLLQYLIPELILSQKRHIHMGPIGNGLGVTSF